MTGWYLPSATGQRSARRFKARSGRGIGFVPDVSGRFFCGEWKSLPFIWKKVADFGKIGCGNVGCKK